MSSVHASGNVLVRRLPLRIAARGAFSKRVIPVVGSGDVADVFFCAPDRCVILMADVSGRGPDAARCARFLQFLVQTLEDVTSPANVLERVNLTYSRYLTDTSLGERFASMFLASLNQGALTYASAGHDCALIVDHSSREHRHLRPTGMLLGVFPEERYCETTLGVSYGDCLVLATDGVTDVRDCEGGFFGSYGVATNAMRAIAAEREDLAGAIFEAAQKQAGDVFRDDASVLCVRLA